MARAADLAVALATTNDAPGVRVVDGQMLRAARRKGIVKAGACVDGFVPGVCGVAQEHAQ